jgi:hypothetical protein
MAKLARGLFLRDASPSYAD